MTAFVLIHGAFRGGWAWDRVRPLLDSAGHQTFAPDLTDPAATLDSYIVDIRAVFNDNALERAVLVGHSQGGFIAKAASEILADRIERLVYIDAPVPSHGQTAFDFRPAGTAPPPVERGHVIAARPVEPGDGVTAEDAAWINARLVAQPVTPSMDAVELRSSAAASIPETFVFFSKTPDGFPCAITRRQLDERGTAYELIDAPHDGIVTHPTAVAELLLKQL